MPYYVYLLRDPRDGEPFYVGKGTGGRMYAHYKDFLRGTVNNQAKHDRIAAIVAAKQEPIAERVGSYDLEDDAYEHERELISTYSGLTNILAGGRGWRLSREEIQRRVSERNFRISQTPKAQADLAKAKAECIRRLDLWGPNLWRLKAQGGMRKAYIEACEQMGLVKYA